MLGRKLQTGVRSCFFLDSLQRRPEIVASQNESELATNRLTEGRKEVIRSNDLRHWSVKEQIDTLHPS